MCAGVEDHMPEVGVIDGIGTELEAAAARTMAGRGVQLVGTAHGTTLDNLMLNPTLSDLVGGIQSVTLGDEEARRRGSQKSILERKAPPTFDIIVEIQSWERVALHQDVAETVDALLRYPMVSRLHFLECSGNSRLMYNATPPTLTCGQVHGMVSCSEWTGVPLRLLLEEAGADLHAPWLLAEGAAVEGAAVDLIRRAAAVGGIGEHVVDDQQAVAGQSAAVGEHDVSQLAVIPEQFDHASRVDGDLGPLKQSALLLAQVVDHHLFPGRQRPGAAQQLLNWELEITLFAVVRWVSRHAPNYRADTGIDWAVDGGSPHGADVALTWPYYSASSGRRGRADGHPRQRAVPRAIPLIARGHAVEPPRGQAGDLDHGRGRFIPRLHATSGG